MRDWDWEDIILGFLVTVVVLFVLFFMGSFVYMMSDCMINSNSRFC